MRAFDELPPKVQIIFLQGYKRALEDLNGKLEEQTLKVQEKIAGLQKQDGK